MESHFPPSSVIAFAYHNRLLTPELVKRMACCGGLCAPIAVSKTSDEEPTDSTGVPGCPRINETSSSCVPADEVNVSSPLYDPGANLPRCTLTKSELGVVPLQLLTVSQLALLVTFQLKGAGQL